MLMAVLKELQDLRNKHPEYEAKLKVVEEFMNVFKSNLDIENPNFLQKLGNKPLDILQRVVDPKKPGNAVNLIETHLSILLEVLTELQSTLNWSKKL